MVTDNLPSETCHGYKYIDFGPDNNIYVSGGGRKNKFLIKKIEKKINKKINMIDNLDLNGDFVESQAFAFLGIRSLLNLPISFPETTGCKEPSSGGVSVSNF